MIKYLGSKERYAGQITRVLRGFDSDYYRLPYWECCCGSAAVSGYIARPVNLADMGLWGEFWQRLQKCKQTLRNELELYRMSKNAHEYWVRELVEKPIPNDDAEFCLAFIAIQREAFNGKAIRRNGNYWWTPGLGKSFSNPLFLRGMRDAIELPVRSVVTDNLSYYTINKAANIYIDPDYEDTTGYNHCTLDIHSFVYRHRHCNIVLSHHKELPGRWTEIVDITIPGRSGFAKDTTELLHVRKRDPKDEASNPQPA